MMRTINTWWNANFLGGNLSFTSDLHFSKDWQTSPAATVRRRHHITGAQRSPRHWEAHEGILRRLWSSSDSRKGSAREDGSTERLEEPGPPSHGRVNFRRSLPGTRTGSVRKTTAPPFLGGQHKRSVENERMRPEPLLVPPFHVSLPFPHQRWSVFCPCVLSCIFQLLHK